MLDLLSKRSLPPDLLHIGGQIQVWLATWPPETAIQDHRLETAVILAAFAGLVAEKVGRGGNKRDRNEV